MITQPHTLPAKPGISFESTAHFDVAWGKPVFRAPDLPAQVAAAPASLPFTPHRVTKVAQSPKQA